MAYTVNNGAFLELIFRGTMFGQDVMNTWHYRYDGPVISSGQLFLINFMTVNAQCQANQGLWRDCLSADVQDCRLIGQWIYPLRYRAFNTPMTVPVGSRGAAGASNLASVISLVADRATRHGVGNKHLPGLAQADQDQGFLTVAQRNANTDLGNAMAISVPILGGVLQPVIYNRATPPNSLEVIGVEINPLIRVQRRRTVGLGK